MQEININPEKPPCKNCEMREVGCHSRCPAYKEYRSRADIALQNQKEEHEQYDFIRSERRNIRKIYQNWKKREKGGGKYT